MGNLLRHLLGLESSSAPERKSIEHRLSLLESQFRSLAGEWEEAHSRLLRLHQRVNRLLHLNEKESSEKSVELSNPSEKPLPEELLQQARESVRRLNQRSDGSSSPLSRLSRSQVSAAFSRKASARRVHSSAREFPEVRLRPAKASLEEDEPSNEAG